MVRQAYNQDILKGCFKNPVINETVDGIAHCNGIPTPPDGYKLQIQFSARVSTGGANEGRIKINGKYILGAASWSNDLFGPVNKSKFFNLSDFKPEPLNQYGGSYSGKGLCLLFENAKSNNWTKISEVTGHGYAVSLNNICKWKRVS